MNHTEVQSHSDHDLRCKRLNRIRPPHLDIAHPHTPLKKYPKEPYHNKPANELLLTQQLPDTKCLAITTSSLAHHILLLCMALHPNWFASEDIVGDLTDSVIGFRNAQTSLGWRQECFFFRTGKVSLLEVSFFSVPGALFSLLSLMCSRFRLCIQASGHLTHYSQFAKTTPLTQPVASFTFDQTGQLVAETCTS